MIQPDTWTIWDTRELSSVLKEAIEQAGGLAAAVNQSGIPRASFQRYLTAVDELTMKGRNAEKLLKWLTGPQRDWFAAHDPRPDAEAVGAREDLRLAKQLGSPQSRLTEAAFGAKAGTVRARAREALYHTFKAHEETRTEVARLEASLKEAGLTVDPKRPLADRQVCLAWDRVVGPLLDGEENDGITPRWQELLPAQVKAGRESRRKKPPRPSRLRKFLFLGVEREILLLERGTIHERVFAVSEKRRRDHWQLTMQRRKRMMDEWLEQLLQDLLVPRPN